MPLVVVVGDVLVDVVVRPTGPVAPGSDTPATITWRQGGAAANTAVALADLGTPVRLVGRIGDDVAGRGLQAALTDRGVRTRLTVDPAVATGTVMALVGADERDMFTDRGASGLLGVADLVDGWLDGATHLHLSGYTLLASASRGAGRAALAAAAAAGLSVSVDPASAGPLRGVGAARFLSWLPPGTLLTPNVDEAAVLTGHTDPVAAAVALADRLGEVVVTCGAQGAVWTDGDRVVRRPAVPVPEGGVADPVGAGDAFTAGLLAARLDGASVADQLTRANAAAADAVSGSPSPGQSSWPSPPKAEGSGSS